MQLLTREQMQAIDSTYINTIGIHPYVLMEQAAISIYEKMIPFLTKQDIIQVICGSGNNGGDGLALARLLFNAGYTIQIQQYSPCQSESALYNEHLAKQLQIPYRDIDDTCTIIIDALFGTGFNRTLSSSQQSFIQQINAYHKTVFSIDIPSGVCANTGKTWGTAIQATHTFTLQNSKVGLYVSQGRIKANQISVCDLHVPQSIIDAQKGTYYTLEHQQMHTYLPKRARFTHKGSYGRLLILGGSQTMSGAICLASLAALKTGCGLLSCAVPKSINEVVHQKVLEATSIILEEENGFIAQSNWDSISLTDFDVVCLGCGLGRQICSEQTVQHVLQQAKLALIDADAIYFAKTILDTLSNESTFILTPHMKEFAYLMDVPLVKVLEDPLFFVKQFCKQYPHFVLVLKNDITIIAQAEQIYFNTYGNNGLATGGSGDVLAGIISGFFVQNKNALQAAILGVFLHAYSADKVIQQKSVYSLLPSDIIQEVEKQLFIMNGETYD